MTGQGAGPTRCQVDCRGVSAARRRACQWNYFDIADKATRIGIEKCGWPVNTCHVKKVENNIVVFHTNVSMKL